MSSVFNINREQNSSLKDATRSHPTPNSLLVVTSTNSITNHKFSMSPPSDRDEDDNAETDAEVDNRRANARFYDTLASSESRRQSKQNSSRPLAAFLEGNAEEENASNRAQQSMLLQLEDARNNSSGGRYSSLPTENVAARAVPKVASNESKDSNSYSAEDVYFGDGRRISITRLAENVLQQYLQEQGEAAVVAEAAQDKQAVRADIGDNVTATETSSLGQGSNESRTGTGSNAAYGTRSGSRCGSSSSKRHCFRKGDLLSGEQSGGDEDREQGNSLTLGLEFSGAGQLQNQDQDHDRPESSSGGGNCAVAGAIKAKVSSDFMRRRHKKNTYNPNADLKPPPEESKEERRRRMNRITGRRNHAKVVI